MKLHWSTGSMLLLALLASCAVPATPAATPTVAPRETVPPGGDADYGPCGLPTEWSLEMTTTGGLAGVHKRLRVDSSGAASHADLETGTERSANLSAEEFSELVGSLNGACQALRQEPPRTTCADCFQLELVLEAGAQSIRWRGMPEAELDPALEELLVKLRELSASIEG